MNILDKLKAPFSWKLVKSISHSNEYFSNSITGDRKVHTPWRMVTPINFGWLENATGKAWFYDRWGDRSYVETNDIFQGEK